MPLSSNVTRRPSSGRRARHWPIVGAAAAMILVSACSGDDEPASSTTPPSSTSSASTTSPPEPEAAATTTPAPDTTTPDTTAPATDAPATTAAPEDFDPYAESLEWSACDVGECAEATVPIDYDDPTAGTTTIAMVRFPAQGDKIGTLFLNPGGPGASGIDFATQAALLFDAPIRDAFDLVGFDPRGVGASDPLVCLDTAGLDELVSADVVPDDPDSVAAFEGLVEGLANGCLETNPELVQHVTTVETAKDVDVLRELVGDDELYYYGGSYGTFLGATYAALFPDKVGRLVLDGAMDPEQVELQQRLRQAGGFQLAFDDYAADCVDQGCPVGASVDGIEQVVSDLFASALDEPIPTDDPERPLTRTLTFGGVIAPLYSQDQWPVLTDAIVAAVDGDGAPLLGLADEYNGRGPDGYETNLTQANSAINCLDAQLVPEPDSLPTEADFVAASSLFGEIVFGLFEADCTSWPIEPSAEFPDYSAPGAAPILVVGTTGDPATPIESAHALAGELNSGVLLVREGEGHTAYFSFNTCINDIIDAFLAAGTVPEDGTTCSEAGEIVDTSSPTTTAPAAPPTTVDPDDPNGEGALGGDPNGTVTLTVAGDDVFTGDITMCTVAEPDVAITAASETGEIEVGTQTDGQVYIIATGVTQFEGKGTATFGPDAGIDHGEVTVTGTGAQPDDAAPVEDFTLEVHVDSC